MLKIAVAERDITPSEPLDLSGFALRQNPSTGVHDPLRVRFLSLRDSYQNRVLLGAADVLGFSRESFRALRDDIHAVNDSLAEAHVAIATSHTHSGPATVPLRHCGKMHRPYLSWMKQQFIESAREADGQKHQAAELVYGISTSEIAMNRRREDAEIDPTVRVFGFRDPRSGQMLSTIVNYACHPVVMGHENQKASADFPGALCAKMRAETNAPCLFINGAAGDINPRLAHSSDPADAVAVGNELAQSALAALETATPVKFSRLGWYKQSVDIPCRAPRSIDEVEARVKMIQDRFGLPAELFASRVQHDRQLLAKKKYPKSISLELTLLTFGSNLAILFVPGELFSSIGKRAIRMALPRELVIAGFSNGSVGYLSDRQAFEEGGYEPHFANFFYDFPEFDPSLEDSFLEGVQRLLRVSRQG